MSESSHTFSIRIRRTVRNWRLGYLRWQNRHLPESVVLIIIASILGVLTGAAAAALKQLVGYINTGLLLGIKLDRPNWRFLVWPLAGILITSVFKRYVAREDITTGTRLIKQRLVKRQYRYSIFDIFNPLVGCAFTMGFGASAGTEGPTAMSGASIGSWVGRTFGLSDAWLRLLVGIGAGAGISAIFKSPMGGVLFTLEVLQMEFTTLPIIALIIACLIASSTAYFLSDFTFDIPFIREAAMNPSTIGWVILLGVFCGLYSIYYNFTKDKGTRLFQSIKSPWVGACATGLVLSVAVFMFPALFGEGFNVITSLVNGSHVSFTDGGLFAGKNGEGWVIISLVAMLLLKGFLVSASYARGGVAGDFVPTFFAGALAGALFCTLINHLFAANLPVWYFSLIGMGCVMAGAIHAPLMAIFLVCETTNTYGYIFPYIIAVGVSYTVVKLITPRTWYSETDSDDVLALMSRKQTPSLRVRLSHRDKEAGTGNAANPKNEDKRQ